MAKTLLYGNWTWKRPLPAPFDTIPDHVSTTKYSEYCQTSAKKATLHAASLSAILAYMEIDTSVTTPVTTGSAIGTQNDKFIAEYESRTGEIHAVIYNKKNGKFIAGRFDDPDAQAKVYTLKDSGNTGSALFFALIPEALRDDEFRDHYNTLASCKAGGYPDMDEAADAAFVLCDNFYRRIEGADILGQAGIPVSMNSTGNIQQITPLNLAKGAYAPSSVLFGDFRILKGSSGVTAATDTRKEDFVRQFTLSARTFTTQEESQIPILEDWYIIPPEVVGICKHAHLTTGGIQPMRNFMLRGPAGTGKTEGAKAIAAGLGLPYLFYTCSANTEIFDLVGQMLPDTGGSGAFNGSYPTFQDIQMDPPSAYKKLTGIYDENITDAAVFDKLLEVMEADALTRTGNQNTGQFFRYVETPLITAIKKGCVIELQEPTVIANPGVLVGLNALLDRCASIQLVTGETIKRHPDTVIVVTTNNSYAGCRDINQSVISRMNLIIDMEEPDVDTICERAMKVTGCTDRGAVADMAATLLEISEHCREAMISDGSCGIRELISWVQSYMVLGNIMESARFTVLSSVSSDPENRADVMSTCLEQKYAA